MVKKLVLVVGVLTTVLGGAAILTASTKPAFACLYCLVPRCPPCTKLGGGSCFKCPSCLPIPGCKA